MRRALWSWFILAGLLGWLGFSGHLPAQSKKKLTGPVVTIDGLKSQTFDYWKQEKSSGNELYRFKMPSAPGDKVKEGAELIIIPVSGSDDELIEAQKKLFETPKDGKLDARVTPVKGNANIKLLDVYGTYLQKSRPDDPDDKAVKRERFRMAAVLFETKKGKYLIRLLGSSPTVGVILPDLNDWLRAFK